MTLANRFTNPFPQFQDATGAALNGATLSFFLTGTTTASPAYTDAAHTLPAGTGGVVTLNSLGSSPTDLFLDPAISYKVVLKNPAGVVVWTADPYYDPLLNQQAKFTVYAGNPNGLVAGTAGTPGGTPAAVIFDTVNLVIWVCTTTGNAATAVWTSTTGQISGAITFTGVISPTAISSDQNDYTPAGLGSASTIRLNVGGDCAITGLAGGSAGRLLILYNFAGSSRVTLKSANTGSIAANRFAFNGDIYLDPNQSIIIQYDATSGVWRLLSAPYWPTVPPPQGRLTLTSGAPVMSAEVSAATAVYYTPSNAGNLVPVYDGISFQVLPFSELTLTLNSPNHAATSLYDIFAITVAGRVVIVTGPTWTAGAVAGVIGSYILTTSAVAGSAVRGTGAGSTDLQRVNGLLTNKNAMTARNGATTYSVAANQGTYLGTLWTDSTAGQTSCHMSWGQNRKWGLWNAYNRARIVLVCGDSSAPAAYNTATLRKANNTAANSITVLTGLADEWIEATYQIELLITSNGNVVQAQNAVGYNSLTAGSGVSGYLGENAGAVAVGGVLRAAYAAPPALGLAYVAALEAGSSVATNTWQYGSNAVMELRAMYLG